MLSRLKLHHGKRYQPLPRVGHETTVVGDLVYLWGGWHKLVPKVHTSADKVKALSVIEVYNLRTGEWSQLPTSGVPPLGIAYHACTSIQEDIYFFGGRCGHSGCHHNSLHRLSTITMKWKDLTPDVNCCYVESGPMKKAQCGMVGFRVKNEDFLLVFGGYGILPDNTPTQATYVPKRGKPDYGWTNEAHIFTIQSGQWSVPQVTGDPPPPCSNFSVISVSDTRAVMFGGFQAAGNRMNDIYIAEFEKETVHWTKITSPASIDDTIPWPAKTCDHSMTYAPGLYASKPCPCVLIIGGENDEAIITSDCWIFDLPSTKWTQVPLPGAVAGRLYHAVSSFTLGPHCVWVILFGGVSEMEDFKDWQEQPMMADTAIVELLKRDNNEWTASVIVDNTLSPSLEDYLRKLSDRVFQGRKEWINVTTKTLSILTPDGEKARAERAEKRADVAEQEAVEARKIAKCSHQKVLQAKENADKEHKESVTLYGDLSDVKKRAQLAELQLKQAQEELSSAQEEIKLYKIQLTNAIENRNQIQETAQQELLQLRNELLTLQSVPKSTSICTSSTDDDWIIQHDEIIIEKKEDMSVIRSRTGDYRNGTFRGSKVKVKQIPKLRSIEEFKRIMILNSKLRHPNLLLYIGATVNETPLVITEYFFYKSLNIHLEESPLSRSHIISLTKDVACALNYLHLFPTPIVHGSLSSHVVFLEPKPSGWKGKLTDVGFSPQLVQPRPTYAAPEVNVGATFSPQVDVYSFGVLLIEMYCRKALGTSSSERTKQLQHINWPPLVTVIRLCLSLSSSDRPVMSKVLSDVEQLV